MRLIDADALFSEIKGRHDMFADCEYIGDKARRDELSSFMADIVNAPTIGGWISVKDKLPDDTAKGRLYLVVNNGNVDVGIFHYGLWLLPTNNVNVSHWMPFPDAPKEGEGN